MAAPAHIARENGKKGGRPKGTLAQSTINAMQAKQKLIEAYIKEAEPINRALLDKAKSGDIQAIRELHDRVYGKAPQDIKMEGEMIAKIISIDE